MTKFYTTVGIFRLKKDSGNNIYPTIFLRGKECRLDVQEMLLWSVMNWEILKIEQIIALYEKRKQEAKAIFSRSFDETLERLIVRGLVSVGEGETDEEAIYNMISKLYIIPLHADKLLKLYVFLKMIFKFGIPIRIAKQVYKKDNKTEDEKRIMKLVLTAQMSAAEIVKCIDSNKTHFDNEEEMVSFLYRDKGINENNFSEFTKGLSTCRTVISSIANLYLRRQILFERK